MNGDVKIRWYGTPGDLAGIEQLVTRVVLECYGHLLSGYKFDADENWPASWIAEDAGAIVGVMLTGEDWLEDLWMHASHRAYGIGARLLGIAESEIADRDYEIARLRLVSENVHAIRFYARHGWNEDRRYPHEINGFEMVEMTKRLVGFTQS
jgi:GNAT superfamily N-acetyltransferase